MPELWISQRITYPTKRCVTLIIHLAVLQTPSVGSRQLTNPQKAPDLRQMPVYDGVYAHEIGPALVRPVEMRQVRPVGVRPPGPDEDGLDVVSAVVGGVKVLRERVAEGDAFGGDVGEGEVVCARGGVDE